MEMEVPDELHGGTTLAMLWLVGFLFTLICSSSITDTIDLKHLHDTNQHDAIIKFIESAGAFVLEEFYHEKAIDEQTLFDIAALTGNLELFYCYSRVSEEERQTRDQFVKAVKYATPSADRYGYGRPASREITSEEWTELQSRIFGGAEK